MNQINESRLRLTTHLYALYTILLLLALGAAPKTVQGQWTTGGGNTTTTDNVGIGTAAPTTKLDVAGVSKAEAISIGGASAEKTFGVMWNNAVANQKVILYWPTSTQVDGIFEITVTGHYWYSNSNGGIRKRIVINGRGDGVLNMQQSEVPFRLGYTGSSDTISDIKWDATNKRYYFIVANLDGAQNGITIHVKSITPLATTANADKLAISPIYTTDTTVYPQLFTSFMNSNVGINITAPVGLFNVTGGGTNHYNASLENVLVNAQQGTVTSGQTRNSIFGSVNVGHDNNTASGVYGHVTAGSGQNFSLGSMAGVRGYAAAPPNTVFNTTFRTYGGHFVGENPSTMSNGNPHFIYGIYAKAGSSFGTASEVQYAGYFENNITAGNDAFGLYQATAGARNYFAGSVGIGTASPAYKLDVNGEINATGLRINGTPIGTGSSSPWAVSSGNTYYNTGNVGIGHTNPASRLDVMGTGNIWSGSRHAAANGNMAAGSLTLGNTSANFGGGNGWNANTAGLMLETADNTEVVVHDAGQRLASLMYFEGGAANRITIGRNMGWGAISAVAINGDVTVAGSINAKYQDVAEWVGSSQKLEAGTVVALDPEKSNQVLASSEAYDAKVAGVISAQPGITLGEGGEGKVLVATTGRVKVKVDATRAPIKIGDLLVTSDVAGVAMKSEPVSVGSRLMHLPGTLIGKALEPLEKGAGEILVLLSLQ